MAADRQAAANFAEARSDELEAPVSDSGSAIWTTQQFRLNTAHAKILTLLLAFNHPVDLLTGQKVDLDKALHHANSREFHHFFPRNYLIARGASNRRASLLANYIMLTADSNKKISNRAPSDYLKDVEASLGKNLRPALESNLISDEAYAAAKEDDYDKFLLLRADTIYSRSKELTGWR